MSFDPKAFLKLIQEDTQVPRRDLTANLRHIHIDKDKEDGGDGPFAPFRTSWMRKPTDKLKQLYIDRLGEEKAPEEKKADEDPKPRRRRRSKKEEKAEEKAEEKVEAKTEEKEEEAKPKRLRRSKKEEAEDKTTVTEIPAGSEVEEKINHLGTMLDEQAKLLVKLSDSMEATEKKFTKRVGKLEKIALALGDSLDIVKALLVDTRLALASGEVEVYGGSDSETPADFMKDELFQQTAEDLGIKIEGNG